jgi:Protein of unknown function (DUF3551)
MKQLLKMAAAPAAAAIVTLAFISTTTPAAAAGKYCRKDVTSNSLSCGFDTMEQCQAMSSGRGGDCMPDPWSSYNANASAQKAPLPKAKTH